MRVVVSKSIPITILGGLWSFNARLIRSYVTLRCNIDTCIPIVEYRLKISRQFQICNGGEVQNTYCVSVSPRMSLSVRLFISLSLSIYGQGLWKRWTSEENKRRHLQGGNLEGESAN